MNRLTVLGAILLLSVLLGACGKPNSTTRTAQTESPWRFYQHTPQAVATPWPQIAIIIDDLGNDWTRGRRSIEMPLELTLAILPYSPYATRLADLAREFGKELMLHAPMEPNHHSSWNGGLSRDMSETQIRAELQKMLRSLPTVRGVNNHMGSALTENATIMQWVMEEIHKHDLYFIDSRTSPNTQALLAARGLAIPSQKRDVFLDNQRNPEAIEKQFETLLNIAEKQGHAIAIGHPYPETLQFLEQITPRLESRQIRLVPVSHLLEDYPARISQVSPQ